MFFGIVTPSLFCYYFYVFLCYCFIGKRLKLIISRLNNKIIELNIFSLNIFYKLDRFKIDIYEFLKGNRLFRYKNFDNNLIQISRGFATKVKALFFQ